MANFLKLPAQFFFPPFNPQYSMTRGEFKIALTCKKFDEAGREERIRVSLNRSQNTIRKEFDARFLSARGGRLQFHWQVMWDMFVQIPRRDVRVSGRGGGNLLYGWSYGPADRNGNQTLTPQGRLSALPSSSGDLHVDFLRPRQPNTPAGNRHSPVNAFDIRFRVSFADAETWSVALVGGGTETLNNWTTNLLARSTARLSGPIVIPA